MVQVLLLWFAEDNGPDLLAGVLWRAGDELLNGVWHLEAVQLPRGVISVPTSLRTTSLQASFTASPAGSPNKSPSSVASEYCRFGKMGTVLSVNLSALQMKFHCLSRSCLIYMNLNSIISFNSKRMSFLFLFFISMFVVRVSASLEVALQV